MLGPRTWATLHDQVSWSSMCSGAQPELGSSADAYWEFDRGYQDGRDDGYAGLAAQRVSRDCEIGDFHCRGYDEASTRVSDAIRYGDNEWDLLGADYGYSLGFALGEAERNSTRVTGWACLSAMASRRLADSRMGTNRA